MAVKLVRGWTDPRPHLLLAVIGRFLFFVVRWTTTIKEVRFGDDWNSNTIIGVGAPTICSRHHSHPHNNSLFQKTMWPEINLVFTQRLPCIQGHRGRSLSTVRGWSLSQWSRGEINSHSRIQNEGSWGRSQSHMKETLPTGRQKPVVWPLF